MTDMLHEEGIVPRIVDATLKPTDSNHRYLERDYVVLVMGPTGAGKSRFIEALAGNDDLKISKDQLESFTKTITTYDMADVSVWTGPNRDILTIQPDAFQAHIIDSPGFSDSEISELEIIKMINEWMETYHVNIHTILYLCPITDIRLSGSRRRTIDMLKMVGGIDTETPGAMYVVTTMWDRIWNERGRLAAEERFEQLKNDIWKDLPDAYGDRPITKFLNTHESALEIINTTFTWTGTVKPREHLYDAYDPEHIGPLQDARFVPHLYRDLLDRIENLQQEKRNLDLELAQREAQTNEELRIFLEQRCSNIEQLLAKFEMQLINFGEPPAEFEVAQFRRDLIIKHFPEGFNEPSSEFVDPLDHDHPLPALRVSRLALIKRALGRAIKRVRSSAKTRK